MESWLQQDRRRLPEHHLGVKFIRPIFQSDYSGFLSCYTRITCIPRVVTTSLESGIYYILSPKKYFYAHFQVPTTPSCAIVKD